LEITVPVPRHGAQGSGSETCCSSLVAMRPSTLADRLRSGAPADCGITQHECAFAQQTPA
jgi:hypothetical protein